MNKTTNSVAITMRSNRIQTPDFAESIIQIHEQYGDATVCPENDGGEGKILINTLLADERMYGAYIYRKRPTDTARPRMNAKYGYIPTEPANRELRMSARADLQKINLRCKDLIAEMSLYTYDILRQDTRPGGVAGHLDLLRAFLIAHHTSIHRQIVHVHKD